MGRLGQPIALDQALSILNSARSLKTQRERNELETAKTRAFLQNQGFDFDPITGEFGEFDPSRIPDRPLSELQQAQLDLTKTQTSVLQSQAGIGTGGVPGGIQPTTEAILSPEDQIIKEIDAGGGDFEDKSDTLDKAVEQGLMTPEFASKIKDKILRRDFPSSLKIVDKLKSERRLPTEAEIKTIALDQFADVFKNTLLLGRPGKDIPLPDDLLRRFGVEDIPERTSLQKALPPIFFARGIKDLPGADVFRRAAGEIE